jgi:sporulation integral membrane protein YtvI
MLDQIEHHLPELWVKKLTKHLKALIKTLGCYLKAQGILILISFIISLIGLFIYSIIGLNVPYPLITAVGIAIVDALPIFGSGTIMVPWAIFSSFNGDITLGICILVLWIIMSIVRQVIEPKIVSGQIGIHPIFTLIAMYTGFKFIGFFGIFIGQIVLIILKEIYGNRIDKGFVKSIFERDC